MLNALSTLVQNKRLVILGFGMEGQSSFRFFKKHFPEHHFLIADQNPDIKNDKRLQDKNIEIQSGTNYLNAISTNDFIVKSPGIKLPENCKIDTQFIYSQTDLFIRAFRRQIIGVTGTKGKSTTSSLLFKILNDQNKKSLLIGNIGKPALDYWDKIDKETFIIFELSAHQLEFTRFSPAYSILLNLFPEHLDYFKTAENYFNAKFNIARFQFENDHFYWDASPEEKTKFPKFTPYIQSTNFHIKNESIFPKGEEKPILRLDDLLYLQGSHQLKNVQPILDLCRALHLDEIQTLESIKTFRPLPHRLEFLGKIQGLQFYNDSISTIPEACIAALKALKKVDYLILGGFDRALDYQKLYTFLQNYPLKKAFFIGPAGKRMHDELSQEIPFQKIYIEKLHHFEDYLKKLIALKQKSICLLSPAAASYDEFKNFEERGHYYKEIIEKFM